MNIDIDQLTEEEIGILVKYNKKTVTVVTERGERWNVSPHFLSKVAHEKKENLIVHKGNK